MQIKDGLPNPTGTIELFVYRRGKVIDHWVERNLVVTNAKLLQSRLIGGDITNRSVTQIQFGTNGTAPVSANTGITSPFTKALDGHTYPDNTSVSFAFSLASTEANGVAILEFGLLSADGTLFARKTRTAALNKASDITIAGSWIIQF